MRIKRRRKSKGQAVVEFALATSITALTVASILVGCCGTYKVFVAAVHGEKASFAPIIYTSAGAVVAAADPYQHKLSIEERRSLVVGDSYWPKR